MAKKKESGRRIESLADLQKIKEANVGIINGTDKTRIVVGMGTCGIAAGARGVYDAIAAEVEKEGLDVSLVATGCVGICQFEPVVEVYENGGLRTTYVYMTPERAGRLVRQHVKGGNPIAEFTIGAKQNRR